MGRTEQAKNSFCTKKYSDILKEEMQSQWITASKTQAMWKKETVNWGRLNRFMLSAQGLWWLSLQTAV